MGFVLDVLRKMISHNNINTVCPPGGLPCGRIVPNIIVASVMRSGTHVLIDLILNNFILYKNRPLYIDLDQYLWAGLDVDALEGLRGAVIKTHYPQVIPPNFNAAINILRSSSIVVSPQRDDKDVLLSLKKFDSEKMNFLNENHQEFRDFWHGFSPTMIPFKDMLNPSKSTKILADLSEKTGCFLRKKVVLPPSQKTPLLWVYFCKFMTRLLGKYSPIINTTISFKVSK